MFLGRGGIISNDKFCIVTNKRVDFQMDAYESVDLLYTTLLEKRLKNQKLNIKDKKYDFTITDNVSLHFGVLIGETMTLISFHQQKNPKVLKYE